MLWDGTWFDKKDFASEEVDGAVARELGWSPAPSVVSGEVFGCDGRGHAVSRVEAREDVGRVTVRLHGGTRLVVPAGREFLVAPDFPDDGLMGTAAREDVKAVWRSAEGLSPGCVVLSPERLERRREMWPRFSGLDGLHRRDDALWIAGYFFAGGGRVGPGPREVELALVDMRAAGRVFQCLEDMAGPSGRGGRPHGGAEARSVTFERGGLPRWFTVREAPGIVYRSRASPLAEYLGSLFPTKGDEAYHRYFEGHPSWALDEGDFFQGMFAVCGAEEGGWWTLCSPSRGAALGAVEALGRRGVTAQFRARANVLGERSFTVRWAFTGRAPRPGGPERFTFRRVRTVTDAPNGPGVEIFTEGPFGVVRDGLAQKSA